MSNSFNSLLIIFSCFWFLVLFFQRCSTRYQSFCWQCYSTVLVALEVNIRLFRFSVYWKHGIGKRKEGNPIILLMEYLLIQSPNFTCYFDIHMPASLLQQIFYQKVVRTTEMAMYAVCKINITRNRKPLQCKGCQEWVYQTCTTVANKNTPPRPSIQPGCQLQSVRYYPHLPHNILQQSPQDPATKL